MKTMTINRLPPLLFNSHLCQVTGNGLCHLSHCESGETSVLPNNGKARDHVIRYY